MATLNCFQCSAVVDFGARQIPGRRDECEKCRADVHVCRNCRHFDAKSYNECRELQADRVQDKERANFCDFFSPGSASGGISERDQQKAAAEALFKKK